MKGSVWTDREKEFIRLATAQGVTARKIAESLGRSMQAVLCMRSNMGVKAEPFALRSEPRVWLPAETDVLRQNLDKTASSIAHLIPHRSLREISRKQHALRIAQRGSDEAARRKKAQARQTALEPVEYELRDGVWRTSDGALAVRINGISMPYVSVLHADTFPLPADLLPRPAAEAAGATGA